MKPWQKLIGWVCTVGAVLAALMLLVGGLGSMASGASGIVALLCLVPLYGGMAYVYWMLGSALRSSAHHIERAALDDPLFHIEQSLRQQAAFWKIAGISTAVFLVLYAVALVIIVGLTVLGAGLSSQFGSL